MEGERKYYDIELKNQSKRLMQALELGMSRFDLQIHDRHESKYFSGKQAWRNPLALRVSIPDGDRFKFTLLTKIWLHRPERACIPTLCESPHIPLRGDHSNCTLRRSYKFPDRQGNCWIANFDPTDDRPISERSREYLYGIENMSAVLDGDLDRVLYCPGS